MNSSQSKRLIALAAAAVLAVAAYFVLRPARSPRKEPIRFAYLKTLDQLPFTVADARGFTRNEGIAVESIELNTGPAVASAIASGSADIGYSAIMPVVMARESGLPFQIFAALDWEHPPDGVTTELLARPGISGVRDLVGKTVALNTTGGQCELLLRVHAQRADVPYGSLKIVSIPFPQMPAALQLGTVDALCAVDPFRTSILQSSVKPTAIASGLTQSPPATAYANTVLYGRAEWLAAHRKEIAALVRALDRASTAIAADPAEARRMLAELTGLPKPIADAVRLGFASSVRVRPEDIEPVVESAAKVGMLKAKPDVRELIFRLE